jgi:hypothetical protein
MVRSLCTEYPNVVPREGEGRGTPFRGGERECLVEISSRR